MSDEALIPKQTYNGPTAADFYKDPNFNPDPSPTKDGHTKLLEETEQDDYKKFIKTHGTKWKIFNVLSMIMFIGIAIDTIVI